jgi:branched-chain amino acid transport system substrate-binding protein
MIGRRTVATLLAVGALGLGGLAAGCASDDSDGDDLGELKVGVLVPLTGDAASLGGPGARAAQLAAARINGAARGGGSGPSVSLVQEDTRTDPVGAQRAATKLIDGDGVPAIAGPWASWETIPTADNVTVAAGVPIVSPSSTDPAITELDDDGLVFRTAPSDAMQGRALAGMAAARLGPTARIVTASRGDAYGAAVIREFTEAWEAGGGTVVRDVVYDPRAPGLDAAARRIARGRPDGWVIIDAAETWPATGSALVRAGGWDPARTFTADSLRSPSLPAEAGTRATAGIRGTMPTSLGAPGGDAFDALWAREVGGERREYDAQSFDAVVLIALAAAAAGSSDPAAIAAEIPAVSAPPGHRYSLRRLREALNAAASGRDVDYEGASGPVDLDANGDPTPASYGTWSYDAGGALVDSGEVLSVAKDG